MDEELARCMEEIERSNGGKGEEKRPSFLPQGDVLSPPDVFAAILVAIGPAAMKRMFHKQSITIWTSPSSFQTICLLLITAEVG